MGIAQANENTTKRNLVILFAGLYTVEGLCSLTGLTRQPFDHFGKDVAGWSATHLASMHAVLAIPWAIKPIYGALSDNLPLFGSRRRSYLVAANSLAAAACLALWLTFSQAAVITCLFLLSLCMAMSSAVAGGVLVESGQRYGNANQLVSQQWLWYGIANLTARLGGGFFSERMMAPVGLQFAAFILVVPLLCIVFLSWKITPDPPQNASPKDWATMRREIGTLLTSPQLLIVAAFLFCFTYNPGFHTPLYFHVTSDLGFSQNFVGTLNAADASGSIVGALLCRALAKRLPIRTMFYICVALGVMAALANFALIDRPLALVVYFLAGVASVFALIMAGTLAAQVCPGGQEGLCYAAMMSIENAASIVSDASGSYMFDAYFHRQLGPLIVVSAAFTACSALLVWLLPEPSKSNTMNRGDQKV